MEQKTFEDSNKWQIPTILILITTLAMYALTGAVFGWVFGSVFPGINVMTCMCVMLAIGLLVCLFACFPSVDSVMRMYRASAVTESSEPRLYRIVKGIADRAGMPMPTVCVSEAPMMNAFALGTSPEKAMVCATRQLMDYLDDDELEGVMAHEMSHIRHRDTVVKSVGTKAGQGLIATAVFVLIAGVLAGAGLNSAGKSPIVALLLGVICLLLIIVGGILCLTLPGAVIVMRYGLSRNREYGADETGGRITGKPWALASALMKMESAVKPVSEKVSNSTVTTSAILTVSPFSKTKQTLAMRICSTHPSTEDRVKRLNELNMELNGETIWDAIDRHYGKV